MKKILLSIVMLSVMCLGVYAQSLYEWQKPPKPTETKIETIDKTMPAGFMMEKRDYYDNSSNWQVYSKLYDDYSTEQLYELLINSKYKNNPILTIRNFKCKAAFETESSRKAGPDEVRTTRKKYHCTCVMVAKDLTVHALEQALENIRTGSRFAIDNISVSGELNREDYKDRIVDLLLDRGYKVVAKEYLEKLYAEQQAQQSGIYNDRTTVQDNNFSAVGYFINIRASKSSVRVQIVNVSTGEFDGYSVVYIPNQNNTVVSDENLSQTTQRALRNVPGGSRIAIDNVSATGDGNKEYYKDKCIDLLVKQGYKVVAKEYLEKLYEEQQQQQSGIYNDKTTVQDNNFSAVGYFVNVKITETSMRVQVVNVSTGEYEGNATVNF